MGLNPPLSRVAWLPCWRAIPTRFPYIDLYERIADPDDLEVLLEIEQLTNPRAQQEAGNLRLVPPEEWATGPGAGWIMASFTRLNPDGSRFSDGSFGVYYAGRDLATSVAETRYHREVFLRHTAEPPMDLQMRVLTADLNTDLHDVRGPGHDDLHRPDDYGPSRAFGLKIRPESAGIVYNSVRHPDGECAAVFRPNALANCREERMLTYGWDGEAIAQVYEARPLTEG